MVGIMDLLHEIRERQLELMDPQSSGFVIGCKAVTRTEKQENVRGLSDQEIAGPEEGRCERWTRNGAAIENLHQRRHASASLLWSSGDVHVVRTRRLERKAYKLTAALNGGPVEEFVFHTTTPFASFRSRRNGIGKRFERQDLNANSSGTGGLQGVEGHRKKRSRRIEAQLARGRSHLFP